MAKPARATMEKRNRERAKKERQEEKDQLRAQRKEARAERVASLEDGVDPDLVGIYPGPQPPRED